MKIKRILSVVLIAVFAVVVMPFMNPTMRANATCSSGIKNNGTGGISINVNAAPYTDSRWSTYGAPYGTGGCTWFVGARVMQLTGKGGYNTQSPSTWYSSYGSSLGFSKGTSYPSGRAVIVYDTHVAILEKTEGNTAYISEGGSTWHSDAAHGYTVIRTMTKAQVTSGGFSGSGNFVGFVYLPGGEPQGCLDRASGGNGSISVAGWAFDPDAKGTSIDVHVYIGAPAGSGGECHVIKTNVLRSDVNDVYGLTGNHGFSSTIYTKKSGSQPIYLYAIDAQGGHNPQFASATVNISGDSAKPVVSNVTVSNVTSSGYTVSCTVTDTGSGVNRVQFPTWTDKNGQDDLVPNWTTNAAVTGTKSGNTYTFQVKTSDHNNETGKYYTDIYAWDNVGNESDLASHQIITVPEVDTQAPVIRNAKVVTQNKDTVVIEADITDNIKVDKVSNWVMNAYGQYAERGIQFDFADCFNQEWISSTKMRFTLKNRPLSENNLLQIYATDAAGNRSSSVLVPFTTTAREYLYMKVGETKTVSEVWSGLSEVYILDRSYYNDVIEYSDGVFTAKKAGRATLAYANYSARYVFVEVVVTCSTHTWDDGKVIKEATTTEEGVKSYTCSVCGDTKTEVIPKRPESQPATGQSSVPAPVEGQQMGEEGSAVGPGASAAAADTAITNMTSDTDPQGAVYSKLKVRSPNQTKKSISLKWTKINNASVYVIYGNKCGNGNKPKKLATVSGNSKTFKKLKKGTYYKYIIVAVDNNNKVVSASKLIHVATKGGKVGNHKSVTIKKSVITKAKSLKKGKSLKLNAKAVPQSFSLKVKKHVPVRYESTNKSVATVSKKGVVKTKKKGSCYVYAYAQNGVYKRVKVVVK